MDVGLPQRFLQAELTAEEVISALLDNPDILSAEFRDGEFKVITTAGPKNFKLSFKKEERAGTA